MSATNKTTNYELPIFVGTDKPAWLVDWNGAMVAIDQAIHQAEGKADQAGTDIGGIESSISTINSTLTSINNAVSQLRTDTNANTGSINTITSLIGNGEPTTADKTIIGAINEINSQVYDFNIQSAITSVASTKGNLVDTEVLALLNDDASVGKIYGNVKLEVTTDIPANTAIATFTVTGLDTATAYDVKGYMVGMYTASNAYATDIAYLHFNVGNTVELRRTSNTLASGIQYIWCCLPSCLLFLKDLGD